MPFNPLAYGVIFEGDFNALQLYQYTYTDEEFNLENYTQ